MQMNSITAEKSNFEVLTWIVLHVLDLIFRLEKNLFLIWEEKKTLLDFLGFRKEEEVMVAG